MRIQLLSARNWGERISLAFFFIAMGSLIIIVFSPWRPMLGWVEDYIGRVSLIVLLLAAVGSVSRSPQLEKHRQLLTGLLILASAVSLEWILGVYWSDHLWNAVKTPAGLAFQKLNESVIVIGAVILLNKLAGGSLGSIYIQKGDLKSGLTIGIIAFLVCVAGSIPMAAGLFKAQDLGLARIITWLPWLLLYALANAAFEEIMFRGLFLRKLNPFFGKFLSNFLIALVFTGLHGAVTYTSDNILFLAIVFPLALAWGYVTQKTDSVWGSILFHAGTDLPVVLGIFSTLA